MNRELPDAEDDCDRKLLADVEQYGWHIVGIAADDKGPAYAFSVGLFHSFDHPELIIFGLNYETAKQLINLMGFQIQSGVRFVADTESNSVIEGLRMTFKTVSQSTYRDFVGYALWFYQTYDFPCLQCVWPDTAGRFPWEDGFDHRFDELQPVFANVTSSKLLAGR